MTERDRPVQAPFADLVEALIGLRAWDVRQGHGSFLTFEFGTPVYAEDGRVHGEWHLWVYMAAWKVEDPSTVLAASEDDRDTIAAALARVERRPLTGLTAAGPALDATFDFDGVLLRTFALWSMAKDNNRSESWMLFMPDRRVLAMSPGGTWACGPSGH